LHPFAGDQPNQDHQVALGDFRFGRFFHPLVHGLGVTLAGKKMARCECFVNQTKPAGRLAQIAKPEFIIDSHCIQVPRRVQ
jgi:hypothetical protein